MTPELPPVPEDRPLQELLRDLTQEIAALVRQEAMLAKTEVSRKAGQIGKQIGMVAVGGAVAYAGLLALLAGVIAVLAYVGLPWWAAALIVGAIVMAGGGWLAWSGMAALKQVDLVPRETLESLTEGKQWLSKQVASRPRSVSTDRGRPWKTPPSSARRRRSGKRARR